jgi:hypothetical protein
VRNLVKRRLELLHGLDDHVIFRKGHDLMAELGEIGFDLAFFHFANRRQRIKRGLFQGPLGTMVALPAGHQHGKEPDPDEDGQQFGL